MTAQRAQSAAAVAGELAAEAVGLCHGQREILRGIELTARPGEVLIVVGPNGSGKSSLLRILAGSLRPSRGRVLLDGRELAAWPPLELARRRAMLSQRVALDFAYRVEEVVALGRSPYGDGGGAAARRIVESALDAARVAHLGNRDYLSLSGGEQQRVQLARVLAQAHHQPGQRPAWLLLDEPEAGLDIAHQHWLLGHARQLARQGHGVVMVLHELNLAARYADMVAVLGDGRLLRHGSVAQALDPVLLSDLYGMPLQRLRWGQGWLIAPAPAANASI